VIIHRKNAAIVLNIHRSLALNGRPYHSYQKKGEMIQVALKGKNPFLHDQPD